MSNLITGLIVLSVIAFVLAVVASLFLGTMMGITPEAFSRASANLALIAIALAVTSRRSAIP